MKPNFDYLDELKYVRPTATGVSGVSTDTVRHIYDDLDQGQEVQ